MTTKRKPIELHPLNNRSEWTEFWLTFWNGHPPILQGKSALVGRLANPSTKSKVTKRINEILSKASQIKIGVMGDTQARMDRNDYRNNFDFVTRVYKTTSKETAREYEVELIKKYKKSHPEKVLNISETKASRLVTYNGSYYIYVVFNKL
jgi:negative regulator of genetic competence, sporulation and motility